MRRMYAMRRTNVASTAAADRESLPGAFLRTAADDEGADEAIAAAVEVVATDEGVAPEVSPVPSLSSEAAGASFAGGFAEAARLAASSSPRHFFFARRASLAWRDCSTNAG